MQYDWILFDADETLFSFDAFQGLHTMFAQLGVDFTRVAFEEYQKLNQSLWIKYQQGEIDSKQLQEQRFWLWASRVEYSAAELNHRFINVMAELCLPLKGVMEVIPQLAKKAKLGIITNGFTQLQQVRLEKTGLQPYFDFTVISEEVGVAKPDEMIFESAFELMGFPDKSRILMVGDNPDSDILGGNNAGIDTCWLNVECKAAPPDILPTYDVDSWQALANLLLNSALNKNANPVNLS